MSIDPETRAAMRLPAEATPSGRGALTCLSLALLLPSLSASIANVGLPALSQAFGASIPQVQWIVLAYLLATTSLAVSAGRWGDLAGRRRSLLAGILLFTAASGVSGLASSLTVLVAARALQGLGAAVMMALSLALVGETTPKATTGRAMGWLGTMSAIGTALGPSLGGALLAGFGWRAIFLLNVPLGVLLLLWTWRSLPPDRSSMKAVGVGFGLVGTVLLASSLGACALAVTLGRGRLGWLPLALWGTAALGAGLFVAVERRTTSPLLPWAMLRGAALRESLATSLLVSSVLMSTLVVGPFYLTQALGLDAAQVGLVMSFGPVFAALTGVPAGLLVDRFGARRTLFAGLAGIAVSCALLAALPTGLGCVGYAVPMALMTIHYSLFQAANQTAALAGAPPNQRGVVSGLLQLSRNLGFVTGASALGAVYALTAAARNPLATPAEAAAGGLRNTYPVAAALLLLALAIVACLDGSARAGLRVPRRAPGDALAAR